MGGDGGCIAQRVDIVKTKGWGFTRSQELGGMGYLANTIQQRSEDCGLPPTERRKLRMRSCRLSQEPLKPPVVACRLGNLYNKEALIAALLSKSIPKQFDHIRGLKDVKQVQLKYVEEGSHRRLVCPVSCLDLDSGIKASVIWPTGAVVATRELPSGKKQQKDGAVCPVTGEPFDPEVDVVPLAPDDDELVKLRERLPTKKRKAASADAAQDLAKPVPAGGEDEKEAADGSAASDAGKRRKSISEKGEVYASLFAKDDRVNGLTGPRDAFGTPAYARGVLN